MCRPRPDTPTLRRSPQRGTLPQTTPRPPVPTGTGQASSTSPPPSPALGQQVVDFARQQVGQQVGDGECFALADQALRNAGAGSAADFGPVRAQTDYHWSSQSVSAADARPGDIIQFRNFTVVSRTTAPDGSFDETTESRGAPNHTAVVVSNDGNGNLTILEQNVEMGGTTGQATRTVRQNTIPTGTSTRPNGTSTVTTRVTGQMVVYRPGPRPTAPSTSGGGHPRTGSRGHR
jgi:hypothetical protein